MNVAVKLPQPGQAPMNVTEFLRWRSDGIGRVYELVHGHIRAQDAASDGHGTIQSRLVALLTSHLDAHRPGCRTVVNPGVEPRLQANWNYRVPEIGVTCTEHRNDVHLMPSPILLVEILSPSNADDTWDNVALYSTVPTVLEILVVDSRKVEAFLLRRDADGSWPKDPITCGADGTIRLASIGLELIIREVYRGTQLATQA